MGPFARMRTAKGKAMTSYIDPTRDQFSAMMKLPDEGPIHMLNMIRFRESADYPGDHENAGASLTGAEAYKIYGAESGPIFQRVGGRIAYSWSPKLVLIGPSDEEWHAVFVAQYPNAAAFGEMVKDPEYQKAVVHRQAAVATSRLVRLHPQETGGNFAA